ncbi:MAG: hypothetical protein MJZ91_05935 [Bacteroidales bacterium]|nr:hypothetical protein [Bacteroidales bacterium]
MDFYLGLDEIKTFKIIACHMRQRIIEECHKGKIFVKNSVVNQGTTFRIALKKTI